MGNGGFDGKLSPPGAPPNSPLFPPHPPPFAQQPMGAPPPAYFGGPPRQHQLAIASLTCGVLALPMTCCCSFFSVPLGIAAIVCGVMGLDAIKKQPEIFTGQGLCIGGIVLGALDLVGVVASMAFSFAPLLLQQLGTP